MTTPRRIPPVPGRILVVDDVAVARTTIEALLKQEGHEIFHAEDGPTGIARAHELMPDVIVLDVMMPTMDGFEVCRALRADPAVGHIPILLVTALADSASRQRAINAGADEFISKPYDRWELRARIGSLVRLARAQQFQHERDRLVWVLSHVTSGYALIGRTHEIHFVNAAFADFLGLPADGVVGHDLTVLLPPEVRVEDTLAWERIGSGEADDTQFELVRGGWGGEPERRFEVSVHRAGAADNFRIVALRPAPERAPQPS